MTRSDLSAAAAELIVVGGHAAVLCTEPRLTKDLDPLLEAISPSSVTGRRPHPTRTT